MYISYMSQPVYVYIKPKSVIARIAAKKLRAQQCAIVIRRTIYIYGVSAADFLNDKTWVRHELEHVLQWKAKGFITFLIQYLYYSVKYGYENNPFEVAARNAEENDLLLHDMIIVNKHNLQL